ncbi:MAG: acyl-CoA dehydratase activase [Desulfobacterales bacterium]
MRFAGIDIGSRTIKLVVVDGAGNVLFNLRTDTGYDPITEASKLMDGLICDSIVATGYGRLLFKETFNAPTITEIKAHARGARALFPTHHTILDIGGQDSKAISMFERGRVKKFEMNDRCAAGTGKFLEIMAKTLGFTIDDFGKEALLADEELHISSMCAVFAESEVTSLIARGQNRRNIAFGLHASAISRITGMINRISSSGDIVFTGGVAKNPCINQLLTKGLGRRIHVPADPQMVGALGAALQFVAD